MVKAAYQWHKTMINIKANAFYLSCVSSSYWTLHVDITITAKLPCSKKLQNTVFNLHMHVLTS